MENQKKIEFGYLSFKQTQVALDASKFYIYGLINRKVIRPFYFEFDENGVGKGKPYFCVNELNSGLSPKS